MRKITLLAGCLSLMSCFELFSQLPDWYPEIGAVREVSAQVEAAYERRNLLLEKQAMTPAEAEELDQLFQQIGEEYAHPWETVGNGDSWYNAGGPIAISASSELPSSGGFTYKAYNAHDFSLKTAWVEGVRRNGRGEYLQYRFEHQSPRLTKIIIYNGYVKDQTTWEKNGRVKTLQLFINDQPSANLHLEDSRAEQTFSLPEPLGRRADGQDLILRFEIADVYPGTRYSDVAISELFFDGLDVLCLAKGTEVTMGDRSTRPIELIYSGDGVMVPSVKGQSCSVAEVLGVETAEHSRVVQITLDNGAVLVITADHPIRTAQGTWASILPEQSVRAYEYESVDMLSPGDELAFYKNGKLGAVKVQSIDWLHQPQEMFTITELSNGQSFIANGFVVGAERLRPEYRN